MMSGKHILYCFFICFLSFIGRTSELFDKGLHLANAKNYPEAIQIFEQIIAAEHGNTSAYFNLGNCYYQSKQYGKAIWAYERVLKFSPRDGEAPMHIELCYQKLNSDLSWSPHTNGIQRLIYSVNSNIWSALAIGTSILLAFIMYLLIRNKNASWKRLYFLFLVGGTILLTFFIITAKSSSDYLTSHNFALVTKKNIPTYINEAGVKTETILPEGTKVQILNSINGKTKVQLENGRQLLVSTKDIDKI